MEIRPSRKEGQIDVTVDSRGEERTLRRALPAYTRVLIGENTTIHPAHIGVGQECPYDVTLTRANLGNVAARAMTHGEEVEDFEVAAQILEYFKAEVAARAESALA